MGRRQTTAAQATFGKALGSAVRSRRQAVALSGNELARMSDVSIDLVRSIESGRVANPGIYAIASIAIALEVSLDDLTPEIGGRSRDTAN